MKPKILLTIILLFFSIILKSQTITDIVTFDNSNSAFKCYDTDPDGNIYFGGYFRSSGDTTFGNLPVINPSWYENGLSCRTDSTGQLQWATLSHAQNGLESIDQIKYFSNSVYATGRLIVSSGNIIVNNQSYPYNFGCCDNGYLLKQTATGSIEWMYPLSTQPTDLEVDNSGNAYVITHDGLSKIDISGNEVWRINISTNYQTKLKIVNDSLFAFGSFQDTLICNTDTLRNQGYFKTDLFFAKFDLTGNFYGISQFGNPGTNEFSYDINTDNFGTLWLTGYCDSTLEIGSGQICGNGKRIFLVKLNSDLSISNCISFNSNGGSGEVTFNASNEMYASINIYDSLTVNGTLFTATQSSGYEGAGMIFKWDNTGTLVWFRPVAIPLTGNFNCGLASVHLRKQINGRFVIAGQMRSPLQIDNDTLNLQYGYISYFGYLDESSVPSSISENYMTDLFVRNPAIESMQFLFNSEIKGELTITDISGKRIITAELYQGKFEYPVNNLSAGMYLYSIKCASTTYTGKVVVQK